MRRMTNLAGNLILQTVVGMRDDLGNEQNAQKREYKGERLACGRRQLKLALHFEVFTIPEYCLRTLERFQVGGRWGCDYIFAYSPKP